MEEIAAEHADDGNVSNDGIEDLGPWVFLADGEIRDGISGIESFVVGFPDRAPAFAPDTADLRAPGIGGGVAGGPVDHLVRLDLGEAGALGFVRPDFHVLAEFEKLLLGVEDRPPAGIRDGGLAGEGENLEGKRERILDALELA